MKKNNETYEICARKYEMLLYDKANPSVLTGSFLAGVSPYLGRFVLPRPQANIPQYGPRARLVRGYYATENNWRN